MALRGMAAPVVDYDTAIFWEGLSQSKLLIPHCAACGAGRWPPGPTCHVCGSEETEWREAQGPARLYTWVVVTHPTLPALGDQVPYVVALAEVAPGVRILGNIVNWSGENLSDAIPLEIVFEEREDGVTIYNFTL
jgi:uncharacterized OB-fold protein